MPADLNDYFNKKASNDNRGSSQNSDKEPPFKRTLKCQIYQVALVNLEHLPTL